VSWSSGQDRGGLTRHRRLRLGLRGRRPLHACHAATTPANSEAATSDLICQSVVTDRSQQRQPRTSPPSFQDRSTAAPAVPATALLVTDPRHGSARPEPATESAARSGWRRRAAVPPPASASPARCTRLASTEHDPPTCGSSRSSMGSRAMPSTCSTLAGRQTSPQQGQRTAPLLLGGPSKNRSAAASGVWLHRARPAPSGAGCGDRTVSRAARRSRPSHAGDRRDEASAQLVTNRAL
jgi:hypothetical protein